MFINTAYGTFEKIGRLQFVHVNTKMLVFFNISGLLRNTKEISAMVKYVPCSSFHSGSSKSSKDEDRMSWGDFIDNYVSQGKVSVRHCVYACHHVSNLQVHYIVLSAKSINL